MRVNDETNIANEFDIWCSCNSGGLYPTMVQIRTMLEPLEQIGLYVGIAGFIIALVLAIKEIYVSFLLNHIYG